MAPDAELYADLWEQYQDLAAGMRAIREAVEHAFGATLPPTATLYDELEIITRAIHVIGRRSMPSYSPELIQCRQFCGPASFIIDLRGERRAAKYRRNAPTPRGFGRTVPRRFQVFSHDTDR
jgi:hypothetical protein